MSDPDLTIVIRDYLLDDEIRLLDAWSMPGIEDTSTTVSVDSLAQLRKRHGMAARVRQEVASDALTALWKAGGTNLSMQVALLKRIALARAAIGPDWRKVLGAPSAPGAPCPAAYADGGAA